MWIFLLGDTGLNKLGNFLAGEAVVVNNPGDLMINLVGGIIANQLIAQFPNFEKEIKETEQYFNWTHNVNTNGQDSTYGSVAYTKMPPALLAKNFDGTPKAGSIAELVVEGRMTLGCQVLGRKEQVSLVSLSDAFLELALPRVSKSVYANIAMLKKNIEREVRGKFVIKTGAAYLSYSVDFFGAPLGTNGFIYGPTRQTLTALYNLKGIYVFDDSKRQQVIDALNDMLRCR